MTAQLTTRSKRCPTIFQPARLLLLLSPFTATLLLAHHHPASGIELLHHRSLPTAANYVCQPIGPCQPCPPDELTNPVCEIYHNRRLVDCIYLGNASVEATENQTKLNSRQVSDNQNEVTTGEGATEFQTWEACERVVSKERQDFYEFVLCNFIITTIALLVYGFRTKQLVVKQYRNLAARIGILPT